MYDSVEFKNVQPLKKLIIDHQKINGNNFENFGFGVEEEVEEKDA